MSLSSNNCKLVLATDDGEEKVWAFRLGEDRYRINSVTFFAYNISVDDIVEAYRQGRSLKATKIISKSGHRTIRVIFEEPEGLDSDKARAFLTELEKLECGYEGFSPMLLAIDIPASVDMETVIKYCEEADITWEYADPQPERPVLGTNS